MRSLEVFISISSDLRTESSDKGGQRPPKTTSDYKNLGKIKLE